ncbi:hypothetical protein [Actinophytocola sp.]|uniref:hypothetical protein n=1 Tax=Actinophytocola sp. TaxID=1872138 RepID=UPI003D6BD295
MANTPMMYASVGIDADCQMCFRVRDGGETVEFFAGGDREEFSISFDTDGLRRFIDHGTDALSEADKQRASHERPDGQERVA